MTRSVVLLVSGAITGAAAVYLLAGPHPAPGAVEPGSTAAGSTAAGSTAAGSTAPGDETAAAASAAPAERNLERDILTDSIQGETAGAAAPDAGGRVSTRVAIYEQALSKTSAAELETAIESAAAQPGSLMRDLELEVLLARLAELDPGDAVELAQALFLETRFLVPVYRTWARADTDEAIEAVALLRAPAQRRKLALALLDVVGFDEQGIARIVAVLPESEAASFEFDAIMARAETDPFGALEAAEALPSTLRQALIVEVAVFAAGRDPLGALAWSDRLDDPVLRDYYPSRVLSAWAEQDPEAVFAYLESQDAESLPAASVAFRALAEHDAERLLAMSESLPTASGREAKRAVLQAMAATDPLSALARVDDWLPPGQDRRSAISSIAQAYGRDDPDGALAWVRALEPPSQDTLRAVLQGVAQVDFDRAVDVILEDAANAGPQSALTNAMPLSLTLLLGTSAMGDYSRVADKLARSDIPVADNMLSTVLSRWSNQAPEAALSWAAANANRLESSAFRSLASQAAREDPDVAIAALNRIPANRQQGWIEGVAQGLAQVDVDRAFDFIEQQRGRVSLDTALISVVSAAARTDPARTARLIDRVGGSPQAMTAAAMLAQQWAQQDPRAAANWALSLQDEQARTLSAQGIARSWAQSDPDAARSWLIGLADRTNRDAAIGGYLSTLASTGRFDAQLLEHFSSDSAMQQAVRIAIVQLGQNDPDEARRLIELHISDPAIRQQTEDALTRTSGAGSGSLITNGGRVVIFN